MGKHQMAQVHIAKLNKLTESEVTESTSSTVDETTLAILNMQGSRGITILSSQSYIIFDIQVIPYWLKWQTKYSKQAAKDFETSKFHHDMWNCYLMLGFILADSPWNSISKRKLQRSYKALRNDLVLPSAATLSNSSQREYSLSMDAIKKQLPWQNNVSFTLDRWTSTNKLAIMSIIACFMDPNCAWPEVQLTFNEVDCQFFPTFES